MKTVKPKTITEKIEDIRREFGSETFHVTSYPSLGMNYLWVSGNSDGSYKHRGHELAKWPVGIIFVIDEVLL
jgi:hypothetical protein